MFQNAGSKLERSHSLIFSDGRERIEKRFERVSGGEIFKENPNGDPRADEDRSSGQDFGVTANNGVSVHLSTSSTSQ